MPKLPTDPLAACYALAEARKPSQLREIFLASMVGLSRASAGLMLGRADSGEFVRLGVLPATLGANLPDLAEIEREQHPLAALLGAPGPILEAANSSLDGARAAVFEMPGRLLAVPAGPEDALPDLSFLLLLPLTVHPSPDDLAALTAFARHGAGLDRLLSRVRNHASARHNPACALDHADQTHARLGSKTRSNPLSGRLVGRTPSMQILRRGIAKFGQSHLPVLVTGETGTGKELVAREIHRISDRNGKPFVAVNVAALPAELSESELFGHVRGSFTGAIGNRKGLIAEAHKGTLFLDEIGDMPLPLQAKLLRVLQEKRFRPVGADKEIASDFRLICATHRDLVAAMEDGSFRRDLFYRLAPIRLTIAPLRERANDIGPLATHFLTDIAQRENSNVKTLSDTALAALQRQAFEGNVRELQSVIERAVLLAGDAGVIELAHLDMPAAGPAPTMHVTLSRLLQAEGIVGARERFERFLILDELLAADGNRQRVAERLGIPLRTLNRKLQAYPAERGLTNHAIVQGLDPTLAIRPGDAAFDLKAARDEFERNLILDVHTATGGDRRRMAEQLRLSPGALSEKLRRYNVRSPSSSQGPSK